MKNKLIKIMVGSIFASSTAMVFASGGIPYQNMNEQGGNVNSIPSSTPQMQQNNPYEKNYGANAGVNTTETMNEQGQRVIRTEEVQKLDQSTVQQNPARNYAAQSMTEKFWNMPNSQIRDIKNKFENFHRYIYIFVVLWGNIYKKEGVMFLKCPKHFKVFQYSAR